MACSPRPTPGSSTCKPRRGAGRCAVCRSACSGGDCRERRPPVTVSRPGRAADAMRPWPIWHVVAAPASCCWRTTAATRPRPSCCRRCAVPERPAWRRCRAKRIATASSGCGPGWSSRARPSRPICGATGWASSTTPAMPTAAWRATACATNSGRRWHTASSMPKPAWWPAPCARRRPPPACASWRRSTPRRTAICICRRGWRCRPRAAPICCARGCRARPAPACPKAWCSACCANCPRRRVPAPGLGPTASCGCMPASCRWCAARKPLPRPRRSPST